MKEQTNRPRFNMVSAFIAMLGMQAMAKKNDDNKETRDGFAYGGLGAFTGAPIHTPRRGKFKGYMRDKSYQSKRR